MQNDRVHLCLGDKLHRQVIDYMEKNGFKNKAETIRYLVGKAIKSLNQLEDNRLILEKILEETISSKEAHMLNFKKQSATEEEFVDKINKVNSLMKVKSNEFFVVNDVERNLKNGIKIIKD